ncbi:hypothetical protein E0E50_05890 [Azotobacter chroococcum subsp. isscasi]|uniref:DUF6387 family protein n=1 Tax=Azotobacter chroococcum TaxID=353 RepID=UPI00103F2373|nr:DUF6387 family protein [Azotobacter chroococcum]TBW11701.1 hypothetical protein E0E50_05890 [Azotobacter chroococcum subsp. isscasi]
MAKINRKEDLPEWFKLEKYRGCKSFGAAEWLKQLRYRQQVLQGNPIYPNKGSKKDFDESAMQSWRKAATAKAEQLRSSPINRTETGFAMIVRGSKSPVPIRHGDLISYGSSEHPIRPLTMGDLSTLSRKDKSQCENGDDQINARRWDILNCDHQFSIPRDLGIINIHRELGRSEVDLSNGFSPVVSINLNATDSVLIDAFAIWLKGARARQPADSKRERPAYKDWARYGLLPYLDLLIWEMETGNKITHHVMAQEVGYHNGGDSFRKNVPKLANELMRSLAELEALSAIEADSEKLEA